MLFQTSNLPGFIPKVFAFQYVVGANADHPQVAVFLLQSYCRQTMHLRMVSTQCSYCISRYVVLCSKQKSRISSDSTRSTTTPTGSPGWTSCSTSWRSEELQSLSVRPFLKILSTFTNYTFTQRIEEAF